MLQKVFNFFIYTDTSDNSYTYYHPTTAGNLAVIVLIVLILVAMLAFCGAGKSRIRTKQLAFSSLAMALGVITSLFTVFDLPYGGSVTLFQMFFICLIAYLYGKKTGILTGIAYGFLQLILKPTVVHPVQLFLDFPIAFGCLGLAGMFNKSKYGMIKGYILGVFGRYICHFISGIIFFAAYAKGDIVLYSITYNASYIVPEAVVTVLLLYIPVVRQSVGMVKKMALENGTD